jgi:hypothetical protein
MCVELDLRHCLQILCGISIKIVILWRGADGWMGNICAHCQLRSWLQCSGTSGWRLAFSLSTKRHLSMWVLFLGILILSVYSLWNGDELRLITVSWPVSPHFMMHAKVTQLHMQLWVYSYGGTVCSSWQEATELLKNGLELVADSEEGLLNILGYPLHLTLARWFQSRPLLVFQGCWKIVQYYLKTAS